MKKIDRIIKEIKNTHKYENINREIVPGLGKSFFYKLDEPNHKGYYTIKEMLKFYECSITRVQLSERINKINAKYGTLYTLWEAISTPCKVKQKVEIVKYKEISKEINKDDIDFSNTMNIFAKCSGVMK